MCRDHSSRFRRLAVQTLLTALLSPSLLWAQSIDAPNLPPLLPGSATIKTVPAGNANMVSRLPPIERPLGLRLADIERLALANNPTITRMLAGVEAASGDRLQTGLYPNPTVGVGQQQTGSLGLAEQDNVGLTQEFVTAGKLRLNREIAEKQLSQARHALEAQQLRVLTDARIAFYHVFVAQKKRALTNELVEIARLGVEAAQKIDVETPVGENDVLEARIELHRAEIEARNAVNRLIAAWRSMCAVLGVQEFPMQELSADFQHERADRSWKNDIETIMRTSPEVGAALAGLERAKAGMARAGVQKIPNVTFNGLMNWRDNGIGGRPDGGFFVSVPVPIWDRNQGGLLRAQAEYTAAAKAIEQLSLELRDRLAPIFERYENARFQVDQYKHLILPAAAKALVLTRKHYEEGLCEYDDLLTSQRTNAQVNIDYLEALRELWIADAELTGMALTGSLTVTPK